MKVQSFKIVRGWMVVLFAAAFSLPSLRALADEVDACVPEHSNGTDILIPLKNTGLPANDLVLNGQVLSPAEALDLKQSGTDLSRLDPDSSTDLWKPTPSLQSDALPIQSDQSVRYAGQVCSSSSRFRFNVQTEGQAGESGQTLTLMISDNLHTYLLRKELLRRLGYQVPPIQYLPRVKVRFADAQTRDHVLARLITESTYASAARWCRASPEVFKGLQAELRKKNPKADYPCVADPSVSGQDPLELTFQDLAAMHATPLIYNLALGPPISWSDANTLRPEAPRILRALALPYGLTDVPESVNQLNWYAARIQDGAVDLHALDQANFATTLDDALWMLRRLAALTRPDFAAIVAQSHYPSAVAQVLVEKLIARRNSLVSIFAQKMAPLEFDAKVSDLPALVSGKLTQKDWPGYASRFAHGDQASPLKGMGWYLLSELQANGMETLINKANAEIPSLGQEDAFKKHNQDIQKAIEAMLAKGQVAKLGFGAWVAPIANGQVTISRDVVFGQYLGTNNLVQLADTFGFTANAGVMIGFDALPAAVSAQGLAQGSAQISLTHLKPLQSIKQSITEPLKNVLVALVFKDASDVFRKVADIEHGGKPAQIADDLEQLKKYLGVGESLILTESLTGLLEASVAAQFPVAASPSIGPRADANQMIVSRLHIFRKDQNTILVFKDAGQLHGVTLSFDFGLGSTASFPVITASGKAVGGSATSKIFSVNIYPDPQVNPAIYAGATALAAALRTGSTEVLESLEHPTLVKVGFKDSSSSFQFFHYVHRTLKTDGKFEVKLPDGSSGRFLELSQGRQTGSHYQSLATEAATYLVQRLTSNSAYGVDTQANPNPGQSFLGHSETRNAVLEARADAGIADPYVRVQYRWQGWKMKTDKLQALTDGLSRRYGFTLYNAGYLGQTQDIKLYEVALVINFYPAALQKILALSPADERALEKRYSDRHRCALFPNQLDQLSEEDLHVCGSIDRLRGAFASYRKGIAHPEKLAPVIFTIPSTLEDFVQFDELVALAGGVDHIYVRSEITGFRTGSETVSDAIESNTLGKADPYNPAGVIDSVQGLLGVEDGEFNMSWLRDVL